MSSLTEAQIQYAKTFEHATGMDLLTDRYTSGEQTFAECVEYNIGLYEDTAATIASSLRKIAASNGEGV